MLATALILQGPSPEEHSHPIPGVHLVTSTGALDVGPPSVTLVHQPNEMVGMPASAAHRSGGEVLVPVTLTNTSDQPIRYSPSQFRLVVDQETIDAAGEARESPVRELQPKAAVTLRLTFPHISLDHGGRLRYAPAAGAPLEAPLDPVAETSQPSAGAPAVSASTPGHDHEAH